jgi:ribosomal-protein-alanine N-acetyltransferase
VTPIRTVAPADLPVLAKLHAQSFPEAWDETALAKLIAAPGATALIAEPDLGFVLIRNVADEAEILTICVVQAVRRAGLGLALLQAAAAKAAQLGAKAMFLEVVTGNDAAKALYSRGGFAAVGTRKAYYQGKDALVMRASLPLALAVGKPEKTL